MTIDKYIDYWENAKVNSSLYTEAILFSTLKAGAKSNIISEMEYKITNIPCYVPHRWKTCMDVMILKSLG